MINFDTLRRWTWAFIFGLMVGFCLICGLQWARLLTIKIELSKAKLALYEKLEEDLEE
jgi:hypothetical protein